ncbi:hypothetical protein [Thauera sp. SDU_THAU2]|uniref:hypothetical protein n=1 Tax=Thauera sp. SDU_THAU2 TaxID=3136633 RepID=UPI00311F2A20
MSRRDVDLELLVIDDSMAQRWLEALQRELPWLASCAGVKPSPSLLKAVGTKAYISSGNLLELSAEGSFGSRTSIVIDGENWSWR